MQDVRLSGSTEYLVQHLSFDYSPDIKQSVDTKNERCPQPSDIQCLMKSSNRYWYIIH